MGGARVFLLFAFFLRGWKIGSSVAKKWCLSEHNNEIMQGERF